MQTDWLRRASVDEFPDAIRPNGWKGAFIVSLDVQKKIRGFEQQESVKMWFCVV
jgi:hypothetical protein